MPELAPRREVRKLVASPAMRVRAAVDAHTKLGRKPLRKINRDLGMHPGVAAVVTASARVD